MRRALVIAALLLALFPASVIARCLLPCVAHKVTDLRYLALGLRAELKEAKEQLARQAVAIEALRSHGSALEVENAQLGAWASNFRHCLGEVPISRYGEEQGPSGYVFRFSGSDELFTLPTTALDVTYDPDPVGAWIWVNACNRERLTPSTSLLKGDSDAR